MLGCFDTLGGGLREVEGDLDGVRVGVSAVGGE